MKQTLIIEVSYTVPHTPTCGLYVKPVLTSSMVPVTGVNTRLKLILEPNDNLIEKIEKNTHGLTNYERVFLLFGLPEGPVLTNVFLAAGYLEHVIANALTLHKLGGVPVYTCFSGNDYSDLEETARKTSDLYIMFHTLSSGHTSYSNHGEHIAQFSTPSLFFEKIMSVDVDR